MLERPALQTSADDFNAAGDSDADAEDARNINEDSPENEEKDEKDDHSSDPHYPEYYLAQIPKTDEEKNTAHDVIQEGLYNMGVILKDKLEDFSASKAEFDRLLRDYPDNVYRLDTYYNLYLIDRKSVV